MQANCPSCQQRIVIDDAKVPDRAFSVKCPKCQTVVKFAGRSSGAAAAASASPSAPSPSATAYPPASGADAPTRSEMGVPSEEMRAQMLAQIQKISGETGRSGARVLVALPDRNLAGSAALPLSRLGFHVETLENFDEGARLLEQGVYDVVVTTRAPAAAGRESLFQRLGRLSPDGRRRIFVVLVGDDLKTGDGTQAWTLTADLVLNSRDIPTADGPLLNTMAERARAYQPYLDARRRHEAAGA